MAVYLDEDQIGSDAAMIGFPHLLLCMGVVLVMGDGSLVGAHFTKPTSEQYVLRRLMRECMRNGSGMSQLYCMGNIPVHVGEFGGLDINGKAAALGFTGQGYVADFSVLKPTDGTYAQVTSAGANNRARVRCQLNEGLSYSHGSLGNSSGIFKITKREVGAADGTGGTHFGSRQMKIGTTGATVNDGQFLLTPYLKSVTIA